MTCTSASRVCQQRVVWVQQHTARGFGSWLDGRSFARLVRPWLLQRAWRFGPTVSTPGLAASHSEVGLRAGPIYSAWCLMADGRRRHAVSTAGHVFDARCFPPAMRALACPARLRCARWGTLVRLVSLRIVSVACRSVHSIDGARVFLFQCMSLCTSACQGFCLSLCPQLCECLSV